MKPHARKTLAAMFCKTNRISSADIAPSTETVIASVEAPFYLFLELLEPSGLADSTDPVDGILITLLRRLHNTTSGALTLVVLGRIQEAEILSRTIMESALTIQYALAQQTGHRLVKYFKHYIQTERDQIKKWKGELPGLNLETQSDHQIRIDVKLSALDGYKAFIEHFARMQKTDSAGSKNWPSTYDICVSLGKAVDYRTVYMAMCSQAHHDAEDILNDFIVGSSTDYETRIGELEYETGNFGIFLLLCSLRYYLECLQQIGKRYRLPTVEIQSSRSFATISVLAEKVSSNGFVSKELDKFAPKRI
ncbi:DUF5677 domain-containing protein [Hydrogenophaga sp. ZJX-1]|uniref:DUF5677 domain-containing protein n=1 Tax=Hydrogenophaga sp. ZJX-1 TaxID=3404778 RepID=UPI003B27B8C8